MGDYKRSFGWDKQGWINTILFHARLIEDKVIVEDDNFEEGLTSALIRAGIPAEQIITSLTYEDGLGTGVASSV